jgi:hypothetical protein
MTPGIATKTFDYINEKPASDRTQEAGWVYVQAAGYLDKCKRVPPRPLGAAGQAVGRIRSRPPAVCI